MLHQDSLPQKLPGMGLPVVGRESIKGSLFLGGTSDVPQALNDHLPKRGSKQRAPISSFLSDLNKLFLLFKIVIKDRKPINDVGNGWALI